MDPKGRHVGEKSVPTLSLNDGIPMGFRPQTEGSMEFGGGIGEIGDHSRSHPSPCPSHEPSANLRWRGRRIADSRIAKSRHRRRDHLQCTNFSGNSLLGRDAALPAGLVITELLLMDYGGFDSTHFRVDDLF